VIRFLSQDERGSEPESQRYGEEESDFHDLLVLRGTCFVLRGSEETTLALSLYVEGAEILLRSCKRAVIQTLNR
jgi:hypothetical protein